MIVSCERGKLNSMVQTTLRGVSSRATMPILSGLLVRAEGGRMVISGTDLEMSIRAEMDADIRESGSTVVSGRLLGDIMKNLSSDTVDVQTGDKYMTLKSSDGEYRIREMMPEDFPQIPAWQGESVLKVMGGDFLTAVNQTSRASSTDDKRPVLTGTLMEKDTGAGLMRLVTTDSYRLAWKEFDAGGNPVEWEDCIIPTKTLNEVGRLAGGTDADVEVKIQERQVAFKIGDLFISSRLIEGQFPNYKQLIPKGERTTVIADKEELASVMKRALIFGHNVRLGVFSDHLVVTTETPEVGESREELEAEVTGEEIEIGFNGSYALDGITLSQGEKIKMKFDEPQKPAVIQGVEDEKYVYILMPVRLR
jgi:DNA polymerase III subunit beta